MEPKVPSLSWRSFFSFPATCAYVFFWGSFFLGTWVPAAYGGVAQALIFNDRPDRLPAAEAVLVRAPQPEMVVVKPLRVKVDDLTLGTFAQLQAAAAAGGRIIAEETGGARVDVPLRFLVSLSPGEEVTMQVPAGDVPEPLARIFDDYRVIWHTALRRDDRGVLVEYIPEHRTWKNTVSEEYFLGLAMPMIGIVLSLGLLWHILCWLGNKIAGGPPRQRHQAVGGHPVGEIVGEIVGKH